MATSRAIALLILLGPPSVGCKADFVDERPLSERGSPSAFAGPSDLRGADLYGVPFGIFADGHFGGRAGHLAVGDAALFRGDDGHVELRFSDLFEVSQVPGPVVVLTSQESLGTTIDATRSDLALGPLTAYSGQQSYPVGDPGERRYAFVYCLSYGLEVARAQMVDAR